MGIADLWNGHVAADDAAKKEQMRLNGARHEANVKRQEAANDREIQDKKAREELLRVVELEEKEYAAKKQADLADAQNELRQMNNSQFNATDIDNKNRLEKMQELNENILTNERIRETEDKNRLAERNIAEKMRVESRQKEIEAEQGKIVLDAKKETSALQDAKIAEANQQSERLNAEKKENEAAILKLKERQQEALAYGVASDNTFELRSKAIDQIFETGNVRLGIAYDNDLKDRTKVQFIDSIWRQSKQIVDLGTQISGKLKVMTDYEKTCETLLPMTLKLVQRMEVDVSSLQTSLISPPFKKMDSLDEERKVIADQAFIPLLGIKSVIEEWKCLSTGGVKGVQLASAMLEKRDELELYVVQSSKLLLTLPLPVPSEENFNAVILQTCQAINNEQLIESSQLKLKPQEPSKAIGQ